MKIKVYKTTISLGIWRKTVHNIYSLTAPPEQYMSEPIILDMDPSAMTAILHPYAIGAISEESAAARLVGYEERLSIIKEATMHE